MQFGVSLFATHFGASPAEIAAEAERLGFESFFVSEHSHIPVDTQFPLQDAVPMVYRSMYDPFIALAAAAAVTRKIKLGTSICILPQHDPINCAKTISTLDRISRGRVLFGIRRGWNPPEMENHGVAFEDRFKVTREHIETMKCLWSDEEAEYHGRFVNLSRSWQWPKPVQRPHPPILVAGAGANVLKRVIDYGDGWMPILAAEWIEALRNKMTPLRELPAMMAEQRRLASVAGRSTPSVTALGLTAAPEHVDFLAELGVDRMVLSLPYEDSDQAFAELHAYAHALSAYMR